MPARSADFNPMVNKRKRDGLSAANHRNANAAANCDFGAEGTDLTNANFVTDSTASCR